MGTLSLEDPIATALGLLLVAGLFRMIDIFVLRLDEIWGEIIVSKIAGIVLLAWLSRAFAGKVESRGGFPRRHESDSRFPLG